MGARKTEKIRSYTHIYIYIYSVILSRNAEFLDKNNTQFPPPSGPDDA